MSKRDNINEMYQKLLSNTASDERGEIKFRTPIELAQAHWNGFKTPPHIQLINKKLMEIDNGDIDRLGVFMPPRHGKSELLSKYFLAWYIMEHPDERIIFITYAASFAADFGLEVREIIDEFGGDIKLHPDQKAKNNFKIAGHRGSCIFQGVGGQITGKGANILIIDDPIKDAAQAESETQRRTAVEFYRRVARTRMEPDSKMVLIQTRWHVEDLAGYILDNEAEQWEILELPAIAQPGDLLKRTPGQALWPERYSTEDLALIKRDVGTAAFESLYQQNPVIPGGNEFKIEWLRTFSGGQQDFFLTTVAAIDPAISEKERADSSVITIGSMGQDKKIYIRMHRGGHWNFNRQIEEIKQIQQMYSPQVFLIETIAYQLALKQYLQENTLVPVKELKRPAGSKETHIRSMSPLIENGQVLFYDPLSEEFLSEYEQFPAGKHDDYLDSTEMVITYLKQNGGLSPYTTGENSYYYYGSEGYNKRKGNRRQYNPYSGSVSVQEVKNIFRI